MPDVQRAAETPTQAGLELQDLCTFTSIAPTSPRWLLLLLLLYAPIGLCLCAMRVAAAVVLAVLLTLLPASIVEPAGTIAIWILCACCGVVVRTRCTDGAPASTAAARLAAARVIVANHQSQIDSWPFRLLTPIAVVVRETYRGTSSLLPVAKLTAAAFEPIFVPTPGSASEAEEREARAATRAAVKRHVRSSPKPLLCFPEGSITNGQGLMRFSAFVFGLDAPIQPVAVRWRAPFPLSFDTVWSPLHWNLVRMAVQPFHWIELAVLPPVERREGEEAAAFAQRTAAVIAAELGVPATQHSTEDKRVLLTRVKRAGKARFLRDGFEKSVKEE